MVAVYTYEISEAKKREWWTEKVGKPLVLEGMTTDMMAKSAKVIGRLERDGEKLVKVEVVYW